MELKANFLAQSISSCVNDLVNCPFQPYFVFDYDIDIDIDVDPISRAILS